MERENPFKKIGTPPREVPKELKDKVMADVASVKLITDMAGLFTSNYQAALKAFFRTKSKNKNN
ncbi:hypothetical protein [Aquimarina latercula]|uniref:hypothetical protein n=1 Tax=Aquimarina latercula TaxID=987 RepID=UPI00040960F7|nr:hypothetical protein [Aquimarina latercula]